MTIGELLVKVGADPSGLQDLQQSLTSAGDNLTDFANEAKVAGDAFDSSLADSLQSVTGQMDLFKDSAAEVSQAVEQLSLFDTNGIDALDTAFGSLNDNIPNMTRNLEEIPPALHEVTSEGESATEQLTEMLTEGLKLAGIAATLDGIKEAIEGSLEAFSEFQRAGEALTVIAGSAEKASEALEKIPSLANAIGQSIPDLETATVKFARYGVELETIPGLLTAISDAARGSLQGFDAVASAFERIDNTGKVTSKTLQAAGLNMGDLAKAMDMVGASDAEVSKAMADLGTGMEGAAARAQVLIDAVSRVAGISIATANDVRGSWQQMANDIHEAAVNIGNSIALLGDSGGISVFKLALQGIETFIIAMIGYVQVALDALVGFEKVSVDVLTAIGRVAKDVAVGDWVQAGVDIKAAVVTIADDMKTTSDKIASDWTANGKLIDGVWGTTIANIKSTTDSGLGGAGDALNAYATNFANALKLVDNESSTMRANFNLATVALDAAKQEFAAGAITLGELQAKQNAYNQALYVMNPAAQAAAQAAKAFADQLNNLKQAVDNAETQGFAALSTNADGAAAALDNVNTQLNKVLDMMQQTSNPKVLAGLQAIVNNLAALQGKLQALIDQKAFDQLSEQVSDLVDKYPAQIATLDSDTQSWVASMKQHFTDIHDSIVANLTDAQVWQQYTDSLKGLDASAQKLATDFATSLGKMQTAAVQQIKITADWRTEVGNVANAWMEMTTLAAKYHLDEATKLGQEITDLQALVALQNQFNIPLAVRLDTQAKLLQIQLQLATATGATSDQALAWTEQLTKVQIQQGILKDQTLALSNLYTSMIKDFAQDWDDLGKNIGDAAVSGQKFGQAFTQIFDNLKKQIAELVTNYLLGMFKDALLQNTNLLQDFNKVFNFTFGASGTVATGLQQATQSTDQFSQATLTYFGQAGTAVKNFSSTAQNSMSQAATSVQSSASSMVSGLTAIASVVTAIASIFSAIELAHTNTLLSRIEESTRYVKIWTGEQSQNLLWCAQTSTMYMGLIHGDIVSIMEILQDADGQLKGMLQLIAAGGLGGSGSGTSAASFQALEKEIQGALDVFAQEVTGPYGLGPAVQGVATQAQQLTDSTASLSTSFSDLTSSTTSLAAGITTATQTTADAVNTMVSSVAAIQGTNPVVPGPSNAVLPYVTATPSPTAAAGTPVGASNTLVTPAAPGATGNNIILSVSVTGNNIGSPAAANAFADQVMTQAVKKLRTVAGLKL